MEKVFGQFKKGFTLAEVLITLVIIGVIAAMTIPTVINNYRKQEYVSKLKKVYSTLAQATHTIIAEEGSPKADVGGWGTWSNIPYLYKKHMSAKDCPRSNCVTQYSSTGPKTLSGQPTSAWHADGIVLADGTQFVYGNVSSTCTYQGSKCFEIFVDINGGKKPNQYGRDVFVFAVYEDGLMISTSNDCDKNCTNCTGWSCSAKVLRENAMNY